MGKEVEEGKTRWERGLERVKIIHIRKLLQKLFLSDAIYVKGCG